MYLLGFDIGSSSVKAALVDARTGTVVGTATSPETEMAIRAPAPGWAEQDPELWWTHCCMAVKLVLKKTAVKPAEIISIGIAYQMHGLVTLDRDKKPVRPAIIWCDSRAVGIGASAAAAIGTDYCLEHYLNTPGNFTASKLKWVQDNEPERYAQIRHVMLPGDYIAFRLTGEILTSLTGLSEGIFWDFKQNSLADRLLKYYGIDDSLLPPIAPAFGKQGFLSQKAASETGLPIGIPVCYRAGDQPNNALSLNVLNPGEVAATGGTSGVIYGVVDRLAYDAQSRVNSFAHVNHVADKPRIGVLLCINGSGIQYSWIRRHLVSDATPYAELERQAASISPGSDGLRIIPFGNGAERMLGNRNPGAQVLNLDFNRHTRAHYYRAALEGVAFSFVYGAKLLQELGLDVSVMRVGNDNLFQSAVFSNTIAQLMQCRIEMLETTGAAGAAIASGVGVGIWSDVREGLGALKQAGIYEAAGNATSIHEAYQDWENRLERAVQD